MSHTKPCPRCGGLVAGTRRQTGRSPMDIHLETCPAPAAEKHGNKPTR